MRKWTILGLLIVAAIQMQAQNAWYNVLKFGAKNDSSSLCTAAIAKAIAAASKAGGGTVYFPPGKYLTGPIHLKSNITIQIDAGAELHFSDNFDNYLPMVPSRWEGTNVTNFSPLFYAYKAENIAIKGRGLINGHGKKWWDFVEGYKEGQLRSKWQNSFDSANKNINHPDLPGAVERGFLRPPFIQPMYCKNFQVEGIKIINSPFWTINPEFCENVTVTGVTIENPHSPNTDGINPESCRYVHISNCHISVGDDCITIKSGKDRDGRIQNTPAENYTITNCTMVNGHGGVVIGSEMSGGVKKVTISNCVFDGTDRGIRIKTARGRGGVVEDIRVDNIVMNNIREQAIVLDMQYARTQPEPVSERTPAFRNIRFSNITGNSKQAIFINGLTEMPVTDISFTDIHLKATAGVDIREAHNIAFHQVEIDSQSGSAFSFQNVQRLELDGCSSPNPNPGKPDILLNNVRGAYIHDCWPYQSNQPFIQFQGANTADIMMVQNPRVEPGQIIRDAGLPANALIVR